MMSAASPAPTALAPRRSMRSPLSSKKRTLEEAPGTLTHMTRSKISYEWAPLSAPLAVNAMLHEGEEEVEDADFVPEVEDTEVIAEEYDETGVVTESGELSAIEEAETKEADETLLAELKNAEEAEEEEEDEEFAPEECVPSGQEHSHTRARAPSPCLGGSSPPPGLSHRPVSLATPCSEEEEEEEYDELDAEAEDLEEVEAEEEEADEDEDDEEEDEEDEA